MAVNSDERLKEVLRVSKDINSSLRIDDVLDSIMARVTEILDAEASSVMLMDEKAGGLVFRLAQGEASDSIKTIVVPLGKGIAGTVAVTRSSEILNDVRSDPRHFRKADDTTGFVTRNMICVPLMNRNELVGVVQVLNKRDGVDFSQDDLKILESVADQAAIALENARLYEMLEKTLHNTALAMVNAMEAKDEYTQGHSARVAAYCMEIARELGIPEMDRRELFLAAILHDVGKIGICDQILTKPSALTDDEYATVKLHAALGGRIVSPVGLDGSVVDGLTQHHERMDGRGYPRGLVGEEVSLFARIIALADTYDAMTSDRPYRKGLPDEKALAVFAEEAGTAFDPMVVDAFTAAYNKSRIHRQSDFTDCEYYGVPLRGAARTLPGEVSSMEPPAKPCHPIQTA